MEPGGAAAVCKSLDDSAKTGSVKSENTLLPVETKAVKYFAKEISYLWR